MADIIMSCKPWHTEASHDHFARTIAYRGPDDEVYAMLFKRKHVWSDGTS